MIGRISICFFIWMVSFYTLSAQIQLDVIPDTNRMLIGDQQKIKFVLTADPSILDVTLSLDSITTLDGFEIIRKSEWVERKTQMSTIKTMDITITAFQPGDYTFPGIHYTYTYQGKQREGQAKGFNMLIIPVTSNSDDIEDIKDIIPEPKNILDYIWWILGGFVLCILLYLLYRKIKSKPKIPEIIPVQTLSPDKKALAALDKLMNSSLWKADDPKPFQIELSDIIRTYLQERYLIPAHQMTSHEIIQSVQKKRIPENYLRDLDNVLNIADVVKFAKGHTMHDIHLTFMEKMITLVKHTSVKPTSATEL